MCGGEVCFDYKGGWGSGRSSLEKRLEEGGGHTHTHSYWSSFTTTRVLQHTHSSQRSSVIRTLTWQLSGGELEWGGGGIILGWRPPSGRGFWEGWRRPPKGEVVGGNGGCWRPCLFGGGVQMKQKHMKKNRIINTHKNMWYFIYFKYSVCYRQV